MLKQRSLPTKQDPIILTPKQSKILQCKTRFIIAVAGRRGGKTVGAVIRLIRWAFETAGRDYWYIAPTYKMAKSIAWKILKRFLPSIYIYKINESELSITLLNGSTILLKGADNPDSLKGVGLGGAVFDEFVQMKSEIWGEVVRPMLADYIAPALFISTPDGFANWGYKLFKDAQIDPEWTTFSYTSREGGIITESEIEAMRRSLDEVTFRQELEASFEAGTNRVFYAFDRIRNHSLTVATEQDQLLIGMDFNVGKMAAVVFIQRYENLLHAVDEFKNYIDTPHIIAAIKERYPYHAINNKITIYPDSTGGARETVNASDSDLKLLKRSGFSVVASRNPTIKSRVLNCNAAFCTAAGDRKLFVNTVACPWLTESLEKLENADGKPDKSSDFGHICDAFGYAVIRLLPLSAIYPYGHVAGVII